MNPAPNRKMGRRRYFAAALQAVVTWLVVPTVAVSAADKITRTPNANVARSTQPASRSLRAEERAQFERFRGENERSTSRERQKLSTCLPELAALARDGWLTIAYDPRNEGRGYLSCGVILPKNLVLKPICIEIHVELEPGYHKAKILLPVPRDCIDQAHIASKIEVLGDEKLLPARDVTTRVIFSRASPRNPHENSFFQIDIKATAAKQLKARALCWIMLPVGRWHRDAGPRHVADAATPAELDVITRALDKACSIKYHPGMNSSDPSLALRNGWQGDCGQKAAWAKRESNSLLEYAEGYSEQSKDMQGFGGRHCINVGVIQAGAFVLDARNGNEFYVGPQRGDFIITTLGGYTDLPEFEVASPYSGVNGGHGRGAGIRLVRMAHLSTRSAGDYAEPLRRLQPPQPVADYFYKRKELRLRLYSRQPPRITGAPRTMKETVDR